MSSLVPLSPDALLPHTLPRGWRRERNAIGMHPLCRTFAHECGLAVIVSLSRHGDGSRWLHVSASYADRCPTHAELSAVKRLFIGDNRDAARYYPKASEHYSLHPYCLHLWSALDGRTMPDLRDEAGRV